jgi:TonB family protein
MTVINMRLTTRGSVLLAAFLLVSGGMVFGQASPSVKRTLPQLSVDLGSVDYPGALQRQGIQGRVLVAFTITKRGRVNDPIIMDAEPTHDFDSVAIKAVKQVRFTVPDDWEATGDSAYQYQLSVLFKLSPCVAPACISPKPHDSADDFLVIGAQAK